MMMMSVCLCVCVYACKEGKEAVFNFNLKNDFEEANFKCEKVLL